MRNPTGFAMRHCALVPFSLILSVAPPLCADVTLRYQTDVQLASFLPPEVVETFQKTMKSGLSDVSQTIRMKGGKGYTNTGKFLFIVDFDRQDLTMLNSENKSVAVLPVSQYAEKMAT